MKRGSTTYMGFLPWVRLQKTTENGATQFPSQSKELKATTGIRCLCVCVSLSQCAFLDHFLGFGELNGKVVNGVSSRTERWDLVGIFTLKGTLFFPKWGWGRRNSPAGEAARGGEGLSWGRGLQRRRALPARRQQQLTGTPPTTTRWLCVPFLRAAFTRH